MRLDDDLDLLGGGLPTKVGDRRSMAGSTVHVIEKIDGGVELAVGIGLVAAPLVVEGHERGVYPSSFDRHAVLEQHTEGEQADALSRQLGDRSRGWRSMTGSM